MAERNADGSVALEPPGEEPQLLSEQPDTTFDRVRCRYERPNCGTELREFRTKDLCNTLDTVDYRIAHHFYDECECGAWIDFIRKPARSIEDLDICVEQL
jgi:hypothetical protein